jgi:integrase
MKKHPPKRHPNVLQAYQPHLHRVVGLSAKTCRDRLRDVGRFLESVSVRRACDLDALGPGDLVNYVTARSADYQPTSLRIVASSVRGFFRFAQQRGWTRQRLDLAVPKIACGAQNDLPVYLDGPQLAALLASWDRDTAQGRCDLAIGLCLARLGMRAGEVAGLLLEAAFALGHVHPLRGWVFCTLLGLLDCTGLRIGEALGLGDKDVDWSAGVLTIRHAKYGHARLIPVHSSTLEALRHYRAFRDRAMRPHAAPAFFVTMGGKPLGYVGVGAVFRRLCRQLGWTQQPVPRLHDLRHTFAVRTLLNWYRSGQPVEPKLWTLSTYLGHRHWADTYWYLTAVPELMQLCQQRFAAAQAWASGGMDHD